MTSPICADTTTRKSRVARVLRPLVAVSLALALGVPAAASADELEDRRAALQQSIAESRTELDESSAALAQASAAAEASAKLLADAQAALAGARDSLGEARAADAELAASLATERAELRRAKEATDAARAAVGEQRDTVVQSAREAYQGRTDLQGIAVVLGSRTTGDLQQRLQWDTTIFSTTQARLDELQRRQDELAAAEAEQAAVEARVAEQKRAAAANVARIARLEADAARHEADVTALVARNQQDQAAATSAVEQDRREYDQLVADQKGVEAELARRAAEALAASRAAEVAQTASAYGFIRPVAANPGSPFGLRFHPILHYWRMHNGTDFGASCGTPLHAARAGTVVSARAQGGFGNYVVVDHGVVNGQSLMTGYAHMKSMAVTAGQHVEQGDYLGELGTTGLSTGCHLHLQVYRNGTPVDPMKYIP